MTREPFIAHSELTKEIYIVVGKEKYRVTEQAIKAVMAIKALEQQPCEDTISRKSMLDYQQYLHGKMSNEENHKLWEFIKDLPSVTPIYRDRIVQDFVDKCRECGKQKWIPCSERLPEDGQRCIVTTKGRLSYSYCEIASYSNNLYKVDEFDFYDKKNTSGFYNYDSEYGYYENTDVIAWMPLPEKYKAESEDKE